MATHGLPTWPWADSPVTDLPPPEGLLLEAMRRWTAAAREGRPPLPNLRPPFVAEDAASAVLPCDRLLRQAATLRPLGFHHLLCPRVAAEEALLLLGCALVQRGARREGMAVFLRWLPLAGAGAAMPHAVQLGLALREAGLLLRNPLRRGWGAGGPGAVSARPGSWKPL
jgi:hypothetical protein